MRKVICLLLITSAALADMCGFYFKPNLHGFYTQDFVLAAKVNKVEDKIRFVQSYHSSYEESFTRAVDKANINSFLSIQADLFKGSEALGISQLRTSFQRVNRSVVLIEDYSALIKYVESNLSRESKSLVRSLKFRVRNPGVLSKFEDLSHSKSVEKALKFFIKELRREHKILGKNFEDFSYFKRKLTELEKSSECLGKCKGALERLNNEINSPLSLKEVRRVFESHPESIMIARKQELLNEIMHVFKDRLSKVNIYKRLKNIIYSDSLSSKKAFTVFNTKLDIDSPMHKKIIEKVAYADLPISKKFKLLEKEFIALKDEGMLVNFGRFQDYQIRSVWQQLMVYNSKRKETLFVKLLKESDALAKKYGRVGSIRNKVKIVKALLVAGAAGAYISYFINKSDIIESEVEDDNTEPIPVEITEIEGDQMIEDLSNLIEAL